MITSPLKRMDHFGSCLDKEEESKIREDVRAEKEKERAKNPFAKEYFCPDCNQHLRLSTTEILRHKRSHAAGADGGDRVKEGFSKD